jgi:hypothetical protein
LGKAARCARLGLLIEPILKKADMCVEAETDAGFGEGFLGQGSYVGVPFNGIQAGAGICGVEVKGRDTGVGTELQNIFGFQPDGESEE